MKSFILTANGISPPFGGTVTCVLAHPQLRRLAACSGFRIEVPLRGTRS